MSFKKNKTSLFALIFAAAATCAMLVACQQTRRCKYKPEAILGPNLPGVKVYNFEVQGIESLESVLFESQLFLEIHQEVCEKTKQEYKFQVAGDYGTFADSSWLKEAVRQLTWLSTLGEKQAPLRQWAGILEAQRESMKLAEETEVQPGITAKVDKVVSPEKSILLVTFSQK